MSSLNRPPILDPEGHLPLDLLRQYQADTLAPALRHPVERHLLACPLCSDLAEGLALADPASTQAAVQDLRERVQASVRRQQPQKGQPAGGGYWRAAAAVLVLFVSAVLVLYQQLSAVRTAETAAAPAAEAPMTQAQPPVLRPASPGEYRSQTDATAAPPASEAPPAPLPAAVAQNQMVQERPEQVPKKVGQARERMGEETGNEITLSAPAAPSLASKAGQEAEVVTLDGPVKV
ncbi:hypothetical protein BH24BAC1_BH24BAC1_40460 [soil metagenome]